ncbi:MAG: hypothetical protein A2Z03_06230 [Chloroflexi bacterium RBG_16_56_8]|nr:MAG: hypothetical protein A2Z03_06230 [Chloroflexi bacterium RBG_16_56_8]
MIRVLIADDHRLVRQGLALLLESATDIQVVGEAREGHEAVEMTTRLLPDVVLMDADMPRLDGLQATQIIRSSGLPSKVIILTAMSDENLQRKALANGAQAYLLKTSERDQLTAAVRAAYAEGTSGATPKP